MANRRPIPFAFAIAAGSSRTALASGSDLLNLYPRESAAGAEFPLILVGSPGTSVHGQIGPEQVYGLHYFLDRIYAVTADGIYAVASDGSVRLIKALPIAGRCGIADNGRQMLVVDGTNGYLMDELENVTTITSPGFRRAFSVTFFDGFFVLVARDTGQYFISGLYDGLNYDPLDFKTAESAPDSLLGCLNDHEELWLFGTKTIEVHYNVGTGDFPFARAQGGVIEHGCASPWSFAKLDNRVMWLSHEGHVLAAATAAAQRISTNAIDDQIKAQRAHWGFAQAYTYYDAGSAFFVLTVGDTTLVYDASTQQWHRRGHIDFGRHHGSCYVNAWNRHFIGHFATGQVLEMSETIYKDGDRPLVSRALSGPIALNRQYLRHAEVEIVVEPGVGHQTGEGTDPLLALDWTDDGKTFSTERYAPIGKIGERYRRCRFRRLGRAVSRRYRASISDPVPRSIAATGFVVPG